MEKDHSKSDRCQQTEMFYFLEMSGGVDWHNIMIVWIPADVHANICAYVCVYSRVRVWGCVYVRVRVFLCVICLNVLACACWRMRACACVLMCECGCVCVCVCESVCVHARVFVWYTLTTCLIWARDRERERERTFLLNYCIKFII